MMQIDHSLTPAALVPATRRVFEIAGPKILALNERWETSQGAPVFTAAGKYTTRGWTEWTQGFQYGAGLLTFDATGEWPLLEAMRKQVVDRMAPHITHRGVHDHGFNNISTYGNLRRLMREGRLPHNDWELNFYNLALKASGAVQAARWSATPKGGYIYSFNGPHSLFVDTIRSLRILAVAHQLGHVLMEEGDVRVDLLNRLLEHGMTCAQTNIYYGAGRDRYDTAATRGRTCHEAIFNPSNGQFRCPSSQQGYSPFSTWTRGLAWALLGYAEQLEFLAVLPESSMGKGPVTKGAAVAAFQEAAEATAEFYLAHAASDGIVYWDTGAPGLVHLGDYLGQPAKPFNDHEPVDSSAAAIAAQGFLRLAQHMGVDGGPLRQAGLTIARTLFSEPYLSAEPGHEGLLLHSVYHRPNGWDYVPAGRKIPCGESSMWGDYHLLELALLIQRLAENRYLTFFDMP